MAPPHLNPFPCVELGETRFLVDKSRPVAFLQSDDSARFATWPDAPLPRHTATARLVTAPNAVWVVYEEATADAIELPWSTAVRLREDGSAAAIDIGKLSVIGADSAGIWASTRSSPSPEPLPGEDEDAEVPSFDGTGLPLESWDDFQKHEEHWYREGEGTFSDLTTVGTTDEMEDDATVSYGWFAYPPGARPEPATRLDPLPAPGPSAPARLVRFGADGGIDTLTVDRTVAGIEQIGDQTVITFFPTNPVGQLDEDLDAIRYSYPRSQIVVDFTARIPSALAVGDYEATVVPTEDWEESWADDAPDEDPAAEEHDRIDLAGVDGIAWALAQLSPEDVQAAVHRVVEQLEWLAEPNTIWTSRDDRVHLVESPYRDVNIEVSGEWPDIVVTVEFRHREYSDALYRRRYNVFDLTGRPNESEYLTVYLEEDIATGNHPSESGGVIELRDA